MSNNNVIKNLSKITTICMSLKFWWLFINEMLLKNYVITHHSSIIFNFLFFHSQDINGAMTIRSFYNDVVHLHVSFFLPFIRNLSFVWNPNGHIWPTIMNIDRAWDSL